jgi:hypothetical protein
MSFSEDCKAAPSGGAFGGALKVRAVICSGNPKWLEFLTGRSDLWIGVD